MSLTIIYVLKLENDKYYVGKTQNIEKRMDDHFNGNGSVWTKKYKPISIIEKFKEKSQFDEDNVTKTYMQRHGIENVRGGSYTTMTISDETKKILMKEFATANNKCFKCNNNHLSKNCSMSSDEEWTDCDSDEESSSDEEFPIGSCFRCGRTSHYAYSCYAKTDINGNQI